ncbi:AAA family ATPase [Brachybacterium fresconis]|uniref:Kinase n=1 Tax=Brachybacterium fresconis TaxID=173363 RepID=A0ABS4YRA9_9MICO|nr:AAA family ATPase [Brachybacterium fresconis]MBP2410937.1 putative kinase [Brachybacterium fresconis]
MDRRPSAPTLMLLNGAPGSGKSTLAALLAAERPLALALDIDSIKHSLGGWDQDLQTSGLQARRLAVVMIRRHLADGHDVVLGQYLARTPFLEELEQLAADCGARFVEVALMLDERSLARRLRGRLAAPDRAEQAANDRFVDPEDAPQLVASIERVLTQRPRALRVDAAGSTEETLSLVDALLGSD